MNEDSRHRPGSIDTVPRAVFHNTASEWGPYAAAVARWGTVIGEPAPAPTVERNGKPRLNPDLPRWMMGFPPGWLDGLTPAQQLKAVGNAVCQQQAELALRILLGDS